MRALSRILFFGLCFSVFVLKGFSQNQPTVFIERMRQHEHNILNAYLEYQKLYYEDKSRVHELRAFEELLTVYINQVMEIYETLKLSQEKNEIPRDIASRALVFKNLMFLVKAPLNVEYYEKACYEYYEALNLYEGTDSPPVVYKDLPQTIQSGTRTYFRLIDLMEDKGSDLQNFGKVKLTFRNFKVTANFDPEMLELIKIHNNPISIEHFTFDLAEARIKKAFARVFQEAGEVETYVALPQGTYVLRLNSGIKSDRTALSRFYVRPNQEQHYVMEPLADWIILYENPTSKRPDYYKFSRNLKSSDSTPVSPAKLTNGRSNGTSNGKGKNKSLRETLETNHLNLVAEIVAEYMPKFEVKFRFDLNDPEIKDNTIQIIAESIVKYVESSAYYNKWSNWTVSWEISKKIREILSPGSLVPIELVELIYTVLKEL